MALTLIDTIEVVASSPGTGQVTPTDTVTFGAAGDGSQAATIDGLSKKFYIIEGVIYSAATNPTFVCEPNGGSTDQRTHTIQGSSTAAVFTSSTLHIGGITSSSATTTSFRLMLLSENGVIRPYQCFAGTRVDGTSTSGNNYRTRFTTGTWYDTSATLSSIDIVASAGGATTFGAGSYFRLYELSAVV